MENQPSKTEEQKNKKSRVHVAIRVRPMIPKEISNNQNSCVQFQHQNSIILAKQKRYTFDQVFRENSYQSQIYENCVKDLVHGCFQGYNAAILAYGQTGSGKTYTMGTSASNIFTQSEQGIIPRVIDEIFDQIKERQGKTEFIIKASFIEVYNQEIFDLLVDAQMRNEKMRDHSITIRQEKDGSISICNIIEEEVTNSDQLLDLLQRGGYHRTTGVTMMNDVSSRSHAIFTIHIEQHVIEDLYKAEEETSNNFEVENGFMTAKFFFVDLAGSERVKKTGATGSTMKEGIKINLGLLELGNVISALSTIEKKSQFITYRNSKLTRILQDCLGGNSNTYMIACISPAQSNFQESLNTLKYASKAMNIKNSPVKNVDPQSALVSQLRQKIYELEVENRKLKILLNQKGVNVEEQVSRSPDGLAEEMKKFKKIYVNLQKKYEETLAQLKEEKRHKNAFEIQIYEIQRQRDMAFLRLQTIQDKHPEISLEEVGNITLYNQLTEKIQILNNELKDKEHLFEELQHEYFELENSCKNDERMLVTKNSQIHQLRKENERLRREMKGSREEMESSQNSLNSDVTSSLVFSEANNSYLQEIDEKNEFEEIDEDEFEGNYPAEFEEHEAKFKERHNYAETEFNHMDHELKEKENYFEAISSQQIKLQYELISEMKEEYHKKIATLQKEKDILMKKKEETIGKTEKNKFISKIQNLQNQLKQFRKKAKEQKNLEKLVSNQSSKIKDLDSEIKKFKMQKIELGRKLKEDKEAFQKYKTKKLKELLNIRKENVKKDNQMKKMSLESKKKVQTYKKRQEELKKAKKVNEAIKHLMKSKSKAKEQPQTPTQKQIDENVMNCMKKMLFEIDQQKNLLKYDTKIKEISQQIKNLLTEESTLKLKYERLKLKEDEEQELTEEEQKEKGELDLNINDLHERLTNAEDNLHLCQGKYAQSLKNQNPFDVDADVIYQKAYETMEGVRILIRSLFSTLRNTLVDHTSMKQIQQKLEIELNTKHATVKDLKEKIINLNSDHQHALEHLREDLQKKYYASLQDREPSSPSTSRRRYEDLSKTNKQLTQEAEKWKRKCGDVQEKYQCIKNLLSKEKSPSRSKQEQIMKEKKGFVKSLSFVEELNEMSNQIERFDKLKKTTSISDDDRGSQKMSDAFQQTFNKWQCLGTIEAHNAPVISTAAHANMLISCSLKSVKIWDLETFKTISDLSGTYLGGLVKHVIVDRERNIMLTACEKSITIWDLITLNVECSLKAHKQEIKTMHIMNDLLFGGGKGSNSSGLLVWDLRYYDEKKPLDEKERNQDILTFTSKDQMLFYGTRNRQVRRMNTKEMEVLSPFEPPHVDSVTGLTTIGNKLISGSKDKNLRLWNLQHPVNNLQSKTLMLTDSISALQRDVQYPMFYSGSKDGQVKIGSIKNDKFDFLGSVLAHNGSVNAINALEDGNAFTTASADKTIKLWKPSLETVEKIQKQFF